MNNYNLRTGNLINAYNFEKTNFDDYILCSECGEFVYEYCAIHGPLLIIPDDKIHDGKNKKSHYLDAANTNNSNWMRYVNCSRHWSEQNLVAYQYKGKLYYRTIKIIPKFTELMVFYGGEFANMLGINIQKYNSPVSYHQNLGVPTSRNLEGSEENKNEEHMNPQNNLLNYPLTTSNEANQTKNIKNTNENFNTTKFNITPNNSPKDLPLIGNDYIQHSEIDNVNKLNGDNNLSKVIINEINKSSTKKHAKHICNICHYETVKESVFSCHLRMHSCKNIFSCTNCKYITDRQSFLKDHIKAHRNAKQFKCDICQGRFNRKTNLNRHIKNQICQRPLECVNCQRKFNRNSDLDRHVKSEICTRTNECDTCQKKFNRKTDLNRHIKNQICQRPLECDNCKRKFNRNSDLDSHVKSQICTRTLECDICQKKFSRKTDLNRHVKRHRWTGDGSIKDFVRNI